MAHEDQPAGRSGLQRSRMDRVLGGVCGGIADRLDLDPLLLRVAAVALALVSGGAVAVAYLIAWVLIPNSTGRRPGRQPAEIDTRQAAKGPLWPTT